MATVVDDDDEMPRQPRDGMGFLILISGILCALLVLVEALEWA